MDETIPMGQAVRVGTWDVQVVAANVDAFSSLPIRGEIVPPDVNYLLVTLEATNTGSEARTFWMDVECEFLSNDGMSFATASGAVATFNMMVMKGAAAPGESVSGDLLFAVPSLLVPGGRVALHQAATPAERTFFAVQ